MSQTPLYIFVYGLDRPMRSFLQPPGPFKCREPLIFDRFHWWLRYLHNPSLHRFYQWPRCLHNLAHLFHRTPLRLHGGLHGGFWHNQIRKDTLSKEMPEINHDVLPRLASDKAKRRANRNERYMFKAKTVKHLCFFLLLILLLLLLLLFLPVNQGQQPASSSSSSSSSSSPFSSSPDV